MFVFTSMIHFFLVSLLTIALGSTVSVANCMSIRGLLNNRVWDLSVEFLYVVQFVYLSIAAISIQSFQIFGNKNAITSFKHTYRSYLIDGYKNFLVGWSYKYALSVNVRMTESQITGEATVNQVNAIYGTMYQGQLSCDKEWRPLREIDITLRCE